jgi:UDP-N-acetylglucosamine transferase subunit ALG13
LKVAILNFQYSTHNYGAVLQAAALEYVCRKFGHDAMHLDFMAWPKVSFIGRAGRLLSRMGLRKKLRANPFGNVEAFERFREVYISRTKRIDSPQEFSRVAEQFDCVIVGSDQVWRPAYAKDIMAFFLGYVPKGIRRIAYAASFGTDFWELEDELTVTAKLRDQLHQFEAISCREESGVEICRNVFDVDAVHVLDPVLLVDDAFIRKIVSQSLVDQGNKLVYYKLDSTADFQDDVRIISSKLGSKAVNTYYKDSGDREYREVADWLKLILDAEVVISDSFHCICLALRLGKEIIYCPNDSKGQARLDSLFKKFEVDIEPLPFKLVTPMFRVSQRGDVNAILEWERKQSLNFLSEALDG